MNKAPADVRPYAYYTVELNRCAVGAARRSGRFHCRTVGGRVVPTAQTRLRVQNGIRIRSVAGVIYSPQRAGPLAPAGAAAAMAMTTSLPHAGPRRSPCGWARSFRRAERWIQSP